MISGSTRRLTLPSLRVLTVSPSRSPPRLCLSTLLHHIGYIHSVDLPSCGGVAPSLGGILTHLGYNFVTSLRPPMTGLSLSLWRPPQRALDDPTRPRRPHARCR